MAIDEKSYITRKRSQRARENEKKVTELEKDDIYRVTVGILDQNGTKG